MRATEILSQLQAIDNATSVEVLDGYSGRRYVATFRLSDEDEVMSTFVMLDCESSGEATHRALSAFCALLNDSTGADEENPYTLANAPTDQFDCTITVYREA